MDNYYILTFKNTHEAINAENEAKKQGIKVIVIPTPTYITKSCGISLKMDEENVNKMKELRDNETIHFTAIYFKTSQDFKQVE